MSPLLRVLAGWAQSQHCQCSCAALNQRAVWGRAVRSLSRGCSLSPGSCAEAKQLLMVPAWAHCSHVGVWPGTSLIQTWPDSQDFLTWPSICFSCLQTFQMAKMLANCPWLTLLTLFRCYRTVPLVSQAIALTALLLPSALAHHHRTAGSSCSFSTRAQISVRPLLKSRKHLKRITSTLWSSLFTLSFQFLCHVRISFQCTSLLAIKILQAYPWGGLVIGAFNGTEVKH